MRLRKGGDGGGAAGWLDRKLGDVWTRTNPVELVSRTFCASAQIPVAGIARLLW